MEPALSVVVCTRDRHALLAGALDSIDGQDCAADSFELVVVDNSSDVEARELFLRDLDLACASTYLCEDIPGLSRARNLGLRAARGRIVAFMDDDARAGPTWVSELISTFERFGRAGIVGGPVRPIWPAPRPAWLHPWLEGYLTIVDRGERERELAANEWLAGTNIAMLREPLIAVGGFEERLGRIGAVLLSNEELAATEALRAQGFATVYNPRAEVRHIVHADRLSPAWMRRRVFWQAVSDQLSEAEDGDGFDARVDKILDYLSQLRGRQVGLIGLFADIDDPAIFNMQLMAIASLARLLGTDARDWRAYLAATRP